MKINYHKDTDTLYIHFNERPTDESEEIAPDTVAHFDEDGEFTGIEFYAEASGKVDLEGIENSGEAARNPRGNRGFAKEPLTQIFDVKFLSDGSRGRRGSWTKKTSFPETRN